MNKRNVQWAWDLWCIVSVIGIWPRFIEPLLLNLTRLNCKIPQLHNDLIGFKILHFSDLHWNSQFSKFLFNKLIKKITDCRPNIIVFTGDFLSRALLENKDRLKNFLQKLNAPQGCFAVLGNHDYSQFVTVNAFGDYDIDSASASSDIVKGFKRLFNNTPLTKRVTERARMLHPHVELVDLLNETPFKLLNNQTVQIPYKQTKINICGLEEYSLARFNPELAFKDYDNSYQGIILSHNPDTLPILKNYPGEVLLCGHTHGGQVNLPWMWKKFTKIEHLEFKRGLKYLGNKWAYINRGISSLMKFRWGSTPELTLITLKKG